jgi:predicted permease
MKQVTPMAWLDTVMRDLRYGMRLLARSPIFTAVAILSLALGIGVNAAIFQLIDAVRLRSLPVANPQELAEIRPDGPQAFGSYQSAYAAATYPLWQEIRGAQHAFSRVEAWGSAALLIGRGSERRPARGLWVSGDFFTVLGIAPARGRLFTAGDDRRGCGAGAAVISDGFWKTSFGGADSAIGQTITVMDHAFTVVGVTPPAFTGPVVGQSFDIALPICSEELVGPTLDQRDRWWLTLVARLKPGWSLAQANQDLQALSPAVFEATLPPGYNTELSTGYRQLHLTAIPGGRGVSRLRDAYGTSLSLLLALTALLLLITCSNLATLLLARASARQRELALRAALGASRRRLVGQMLIESLLLASAGAALAVPVAISSARSLVAFLDTALNPVNLPLTADWRVLAFITATAAITVVLFGCMPAFRVAFVQAADATTRISRRATVDRHRSRFQRSLVAVQVAVSLVLVVSAFMFVQTFRTLATVHVGFAQEGTMAVVFADPSAGDLTAERKLAFQRRLTDTIRATPGVTAAASSTHVPLSGDLWSHFFRVSGAAPDGQKASRFTYVSPDYFGTLDIPLKAGRGFNDSDDDRSRPVMIVNESFVRGHLPGRNPVGSIIQRLPEPGFPEVTYEIVGVVSDTKYGDLRDESCWCDNDDGPMPPVAYVPMAQHPNPQAWAPVFVRAASGSAATPAIVRAVTRMNPDIAVTAFELKAVIHQRLAGERLIAWLAGGFGALATLLVTIGLHGLIAYLSVSRTSEIGIRLSLGSTRAQIASLVLRDSLWMIVIGVLAGVPLAIAAMRGARSLLFGLSPTDLPTVLSAVLSVVAIAALGGAIPAWRASRLDPNVALRAE